MAIWGLAEKVWRSAPVTEANKREACSPPEVDLNPARCGNLVWGQAGLWDCGPCCS